MDTGHRRPPRRTDGTGNRELVSNGKTGRRDRDAVVMEASTSRHDAEGGGVLASTPGQEEASFSVPFRSMVEAPPSSLSSSSEFSGEVGHQAASSFSFRSATTSPESAPKKRGRTSSRDSTPLRRTSEPTRRRIGSASSVKMHTDEEPLDDEEALEDERPLPMSSSSVVSPVAPASRFGSASSAGFSHFTNNDATEAFTLSTNSPTMSNRKTRSDDEQEEDVPLKPRPRPMDFVLDNSNDQLEFDDVGLDQFLDFDSRTIATAPSTANSEYIGIPEATIATASISEYQDACRAAVPSDAHHMADVSMATDGMEVEEPTREPEFLQHPQGESVVVRREAAMAAVAEAAPSDSMETNVNEVLGQDNGVRREESVYEPSHEDGIDDDGNRGGGEHGRDGDDGDHDNNDGQPSQSNGTSMPRGKLRHYLDTRQYDKATAFLLRFPPEASLCDMSTLSILLLVREEEPDTAHKLLEFIRNFVALGGGKSLMTDRNFLGETPLHHMVRSNMESHQKTEMIRIILRAYPRFVYEESDDGRTLLDILGDAWVSLTEPQAEDEIGNGSGEELWVELASVLHGEPRPRPVEPRHLSYRLRALLDRYELLLRCAMRALSTPTTRPLIHEKYHELGMSLRSEFVPAGHYPSPSLSRRPLPRDGCSLVMCIVSCRCYVPVSFLRLAIALSSPKAGLEQDGLGRIPLSIAAAHSTFWRSRYKRRHWKEDAPAVGSFIDTLTACYRGSAKVADREGRLPLHHAIDCRLSWASGVRGVFHDFPEASQIRDPKTNLFPFALAVTGRDEADTDSNDSDALETAFILLRSDPAVLLSSIASRSKNPHPSKAALTRSKGGMKKGSDEPLSGDAGAVEFEMSSEGAWQLQEQVRNLRAQLQAVNRRNNSLRRENVRLRSILQEDDDEEEIIEFIERPDMCEIPMGLAEVEAAVYPVQPAVLVEEGLVKMIESDRAARKARRSLREGKASFHMIVRMVLLFACMLVLSVVVTALVVTALLTNGDPFPTMLDFWKIVPPSTDDGVSDEDSPEYVSHLQSKANSSELYVTELVNNPIFTEFESFEGVEQRKQKPDKELKKHERAKQPQKPRHKSDTKGRQRTPVQVPESSLVVVNEHREKASSCVELGESSTVVSYNISCGWLATQEDAKVVDAFCESLNIRASCPKTCGDCPSVRKLFPSSIFNANPF